MTIGRFSENFNQCEARIALTREISAGKGEALWRFAGVGRIPVLGTMPKAAPSYRGAPSALHLGCLGPRHGAFRSGDEGREVMKEDSPETEASGVGDRLGHGPDAQVIESVVRGVARVIVTVLR